MRKTINLVVGRTASGKDTVVTEVCGRMGYTQLVSYTTRPRREKEGNTHIFIKPKEVEQYRSRMVAYTEIGKFEYFATLDQVLNSDFYIIDPNGIEYFQNALSIAPELQDIKINIIYLNISEDEQYQRAIARGDNPEVLRQRQNNEREQFEKFENQYQVFSSSPLCLVVNSEGDFEQNIIKIIQYIN